MIALFKFLFLILCGAGSFLGIFLLIQKFRGKENIDYGIWAAFDLLLMFLGLVSFAIYYYSGGIV